MFVEHDRLYFLNKITMVLSFERNEMSLCAKSMVCKLEAGKPQNLCDSDNHSTELEVQRNNNRTLA